MLFKDLRELALIVKTNCYPDLRYILVGSRKQLLSQINAQGHQVGGWSHSKQLAKPQIELCAGKPSQPRHVFHRYVLCEMLLQVADNRS